MPNTTGVFFTSPNAKPNNPKAIKHKLGLKGKLEPGDMLKRASEMKTQELKAELNNKHKPNKKRK